MKTIFIIDDDEEICKLIENVLSGEGYRVFTANRCDEALSRLKKVSPDLIIIDVVMPEMSGIELCQKIRNNHSFDNVPVIMMTGYDSEEREADSYIAGADDFIVKPFNMGELTLKVKNELGSLNIR